MENREPFKLDRIIQVYNLVQVAANAYVFLKVKIILRNLFIYSLINIFFR